MSVTHIASQANDCMGLGQSTIDELKVGLRGTVLQPHDPGYDDSRTIWNAMIDSRPGLIIRCAGVADVIAAVDLARTNNLLVSVRGGGHNVSGNAVCDGGLMIDLSPMKSIHINVAARTARAEGGATWKEYDRETQTFGLASTGGAVSRTGIGGLTLGGGWGWLGGMYGLACDNLLSADLVTANGQVVTASVDENEDLFWGLRGGGGNFGVVTSFEYALHPVGEVLAGRLVYPLASAREVLAFYDEFTSSCPDELVSLAAFLTMDEQPVVGITVCYLGGVQEGERLLQPLREFGSPILDDIGRTTYVAFQQAFDAVFPEGYQNYWKSNFLKDLGAGGIDVILNYVSRLPTPESIVMIEQIGNGVRRVGKDETAFNHRDARYCLLLCAMSPDPAAKESIVTWTRDFWTAMEPFTTDSVYVNYLGAEEDEGDDRVIAAYGLEKYQRLVALKNKYDPTNLFQLNQNIKPTAS